MDEIKKPEYLTEYIKKTKYRVFVPFVILNYPFRWLAYVLDKVAILKVLEFVSMLSVLVAVYFYLTGLDDRQKEKHYQAWQVINSAQGKPGSGGRVDALQDLNKDNISLAGVDISKANLRSINLEKADLWDADLSGVWLWDANLYGAKMLRANLSGAKFVRTNFSMAMLWNVNFSGAYLGDANFSGAELNGVNLSGAELYGANLSGAKLVGANFSRADLRNANFSGVELEWYLWKYSIKIELANIHGIKNPPNGFVEWAKEHGAVSIERTDEWEKLIEEKTKEKKVK